MKEQILKDLIDAMRLAGRVPNEMPELPKGMTPSYIHILDIIHAYEKEGKDVRLSDIAKEMNTALPGITRSIKAMEKLGVVERRKNSEDHRDVHMYLTEKGRSYFEVYVKGFYSELSFHLSKMKEEDAQNAIRVIRELSEAVNDVRSDFDTRGLEE